jgi:hypothetical protein
MALSTINTNSIADDAVTVPKVTDQVLTHRNLIINGAMQVAQRGVSFSSNNSIDYTVDRWAIFSNGVSTTTQESFAAGQTDVPNEPVKYLKWNISTYASGDNLFQRVEDVRTGAGQAVTLSFYAKADSSITNRPRLIQNFGSGGSSEVVTATSTNALTTSWQKFTITATLPSISGKTIGSSSYLELEALRFTDTFTGGVYIANVQLELGSTATPFEQRSFGDELARCQRYYYNTYVTAQSSGSADSGLQAGTFNAGDRYNVDNCFAVEMRAQPTVIYYGGRSTVADTADRVSVYNSNTLRSFVSEPSATLKGLRGHFDTNSTDDAIRYHFTADAEL